MDFGIERKLLHKSEKWKEGSYMMEVGEISSHVLEVGEKVGKL